MAKFLHLVAYNLKGDLYKSSMEYRINENLLRMSSGFWYLTGNLMDIIGYDKAIALNLKELKMTDTNMVGDEVFSFNGIIPTRIDGILEPCIGYFWKEVFSGPNNWMQRGFVCLFSDNDARNYARNRFIENVETVGKKYYEGNNVIIPGIYS